jgi:glycine dehydrogenase subunit 2
VHGHLTEEASRIRAAELGFDACMFMLHKTFGARKGGGPAVGACGCTPELEPFLPGPLVVSSRPACPGGRGVSSCTPATRSAGTPRFTS